MPLSISTQDHSGAYDSLVGYRLESARKSFLIDKNIMGRPTPSAIVLEFAWAFAQSVTAPSQSICDLVARTGPLSIFSVMCRLSHKVRSVADVD